MFILGHFWYSWVFLNNVLQSNFVWDICHVYSFYRADEFCNENFLFFTILNDSIIFILNEFFCDGDVDD